ncbi:Translational activator GCN1 [Zootermopsis nevadensis]|uniref:Translational activator GCN1 n=1 Tax=Zootermopsis nevadensis TaxID=136037 RepID=A0A067RG22_ZOONE|nr:Translational activator GCN1 [Zootermopsis nevadensis]
MLNHLIDPHPKVAESALEGLRQVTAIKSRVVLPYLVPQLIAPPRVNTKALSILASVAGEALIKYYLHFWQLCLWPKAQHMRPRSWNTVSDG